MSIAIGISRDCFRETLVAKRPPNKSSKHTLNSNGGVIEEHEIERNASEENRRNFCVKKYAIFQLL